MRALRFVLFSILPAIFLFVFMQGCGAPPVARQLISVTISPASTTAPSGSQAQFVATGHYNAAPYTVTPLRATWGASAFPQKIASVTQNGLATCAQGESGATGVEAWVQISGPVCNVIDSAGRPGCGNVWGSAQLTCP